MVNAGARVRVRVRVSDWVMINARARVSFKGMCLIFNLWNIFPKEKENRNNQKVNQINIIHTNS